MAIRDIITETETRSSKVELPTAPTEAKPKSGSRGRYVMGREVPSKQVKTAHRRSRSGLPLKVWARRADGNSMVPKWFANKC